MLRIISVIGSSDSSREEYDAAEEAGKEIALRKAVLVCGGLGGVMEAAAKGAKQAGGITIGILPAADRKAANSFIDIAIPTGMNEARNIIVALSADAVIAVGGGPGTLSELAFAAKHNKAIVGIGTWKLDRDYCSKVNIAEASSAAEAVSKAFSLIESKKNLL